MSEDAGGGRGAEALRRRDEILQVLYWLRGEGLAEGSGPATLVRLLAPSGTPDADARAQLVGDLDALESAGMIRRDADGSLRLTERGAQEGGRRFADAFAGLTGQAHGECADPDCDCHTDPAAALDCHRARHHAHQG